jgi:hypothetical protein
MRSVELSEVCLLGSLSLSLSLSLSKQFFYNKSNPVSTALILEVQNVAVGCNSHNNKKYLFIASVRTPKFGIADS